MAAGFHRLAAAGEGGTCGQEKGSGRGQANKSGTGTVTKSACKDHQRLIMGCGLSRMFGDVVHLPFI
jgi:hypothetical protein